MPTPAPPPTSRITTLLDLGGAASIITAATTAASYAGWRAALAVGLAVAGSLALTASRTLTKRSSR